MLIVKILLGLVGLGIVVFVHELGHFIAARLVGIDVEAFSIGWGKPILKKKIGAVEYRLGLFPLGGYCKMKGENEFQEAWENKEKSIKPVPGTFYGTSPFKRCIVSFMGPFFNLLFAILVMSIIWGIGFEVNTLENRIVLLSDISPGSVNPADEAGLQTGDRIIEINGRKTENYHDIQENIAVNPEAKLPLKVERGSEVLSLTVKPTLEKSTGAGRIGVYFWTSPLIDAVAEGSPAAAAGLQKGDRILKVNGENFEYTVALIKILESRPAFLNIEYERGGKALNTDIRITYTEDGPEDPGMAWETIKYHTPALNVFTAIAKGVSEAWKTFTVSVRSLTLLFRGIDLTQAVSGPVRITYMVGDVATEGFGQSFGAGISSMANFLALISIALCIMNLLPLPILDGGMILLFIIEALRRKPLNPRAIYIFQTVGVVLIFSLMIFAVFGDILFLARR
ncbi:site-2 protease family protein [Leadbettera azotonutricia]|uniref:RIP metalloprotease RseP n=1 Tax=Leadbettera azotonutricia (strain ATCC BAA-888 / DSM 13862 / ZAS-9) TaxID=545695 RepID=F5YB06_LEAAZ|nr:site-2 protease family protein [Leadbettera azotonutricia]AEF83381.1 RIP metalloprotease RseP [Leadbettera azotonutricia ZAS-9]